MSDSDDDEPLGAILKATSQSASPQRPVATRETVVPAQPKADAGKMTPPSSTTSINPVIDPFVRAPSVMVASLPERAPAPPPPADEDVRSSSLLALRFLEVLTLLHLFTVGRRDHLRRRTTARPQAPVLQASLSTCQAGVSTLEASCRGNTS
jgi:hypothetical protein